MTATTYHFFVGNGDMTLFVLDSGHTVLVDVRIRSGAESPDSPEPDVAGQLRDRLERDAAGRLYVDAMLLTHPDEDHCLGLTKHFHLGPLPAGRTVDDRIVIREMWSSRIVFRRAESKARKKGLTLCADAKAWADEARRRVRAYEAGVRNEGDRIVILGEEVRDKAHRLEPIVVRCGERLASIGGQPLSSFELHLLGPLPVAPDDADAEELLSKNNSSVVATLRLASGASRDAARYLLGGDAEVAIWERLWARHGLDPALFDFDVMIAPNHCSIHSLSRDSWSEQRRRGEDVEISADARSALSQARQGALIVSSSKTIVDDDNDPPCIRAKREYEAIVRKVDGEFRTLADERGDGPLELRITEHGWTRVLPGAAAILGAAAATAYGSEAIPHGNDD